MHAYEPPGDPAHKTLFEEVVHWSSIMTEKELEKVRSDPKSIGVPVFRLVLADWRLVLKYMATMLAKIEWEVLKPHWGENPGDFDASLGKLSPWIRNMPYYQGMIAEAIDRIFQLPPDIRPFPTPGDPTQPRPTHGLPSLLHDFHLVQRSMDASQRRFEFNQTKASNSINIEEARRAVQQNQNLARLTFLATIFIPLSFTSSFLSMSPDFEAATQTIWMFFAIGVPLTIIALATVDLSHPQKGGIIREQWRALSGSKNVLPKTPVPSRKVPVGQTIRWPMNRFNSSYTLGGRS
ncbi:hypothetical protein LTR56_025247 [Elasticomyces elasticus]|nr:hypothetical protein LTR56_025247 [Elasticomyces elasticus]KAK3646178.1 hypothetical protein LTR22_014390 [Elasticomyces elasticus]KAK4904482.1 hypothetical protein LTR49_026084 [Elasticomyces elasticus]KAK5739745.1 hypothetical protein LTS12_025170 [Elasticomyces elasticus]